VGSMQGSPVNPFSGQQVSPYQYAMFYRRTPSTPNDNPYLAAIFRVVLSGVVGYPMGIFFALLMPASDVNLKGLPKGTGAIGQAVHGIKQQINTGISNGRAFAKMGALFTAAESVVDITTGKSSMGNAMIAGAFTGAVLAMGAGPVGVTLSALGFTAFATAIDVAFGMHAPK